MNDVEQNEIVFSKHKSLYINDNILFQYYYHKLQGGQYVKDQK